MHFRKTGTADLAELTLQFVHSQTIFFLQMGGDCPKPAHEAGFEITSSTFDKCQPNRLHLPTVASCLGTTTAFVDPCIFGDSTYRGSSSGIKIHRVHKVGCTLILELKSKSSQDPKKSSSPSLRPAGVHQFARFYHHGCS